MERSPPEAGIEVADAAQDDVGTAGACKDVAGVTHACEDVAKVAGVVDDVPVSAVAQDGVAAGVEDVSPSPSMSRPPLDDETEPKTNRHLQCGRRKPDRRSADAWLPQKRGRKN